jgi:hypothetical protein
VSTFSTRFVVALSTVAALAAGPRPAQAQWGPYHGHSHVSVSVGFGFGYGGWYPFYSPWYPWGVWGGYGWGPYGFGVGFSGYPFYYPYYSYGYPIDNSGSVRVEVKPRDAEVYVDGYLAGKVDDFDGVFQRLRVEPGGHELVVYRDGYHSVGQHLYLAPTSDQHVKFTLQPLGPGEVQEPRPVPIPREELPQDQPERPRYGRGGPPPARGDEPQIPPPGRGAPTPDTPPEPRPEMPNPRSFGSLALVVQPADAEIIIDGAKWSAPAGQSRVVIQLSEGKHHLEIQKDGYAKYVEDIGIMRGRTMTLNVSLVK